MCIKNKTTLFNSRLKSNLKEMLIHVYAKNHISSSWIKKQEEHIFDITNLKRLHCIGFNTFHGVLVFILETYMLNTIK